ncbi:unnamed protein product [Callosobruchus maculatus]|uniref:G-protein coupled receptors family 1 profile domain-containing protein n=1 Tax=Callosobruchus maculatus TaxID=64391 RepID=A0A653BWI3_CALMS|nr:unnamed protein product [Callosobruchus maculatus]
MLETKGNVFVIAAILMERNLQNVANYLILSLAVADLLVACLVMPLGAVYEVSQRWTLGPELCDMWTSSDVLCCTASILHLVAIALDRFNPDNEAASHIILPAYKKLLKASAREEAINTLSFSPYPSSEKSAKDLKEICENRLAGKIPVNQFVSGE